MPTIVDISQSILRKRHIITETDSQVKLYPDLAMVCLSADR
jgi:hypothetical protein